MSFLLQQRATRSQPGSPLSTSTGGLQEETPAPRGCGTARGAHAAAEGHGAAKGAAGAGGCCRAPCGLCPRERLPLGFVFAFEAG